MSSIRIKYTLTVGFLPCVSIIAESLVTDQIYSYFLIKLLLWSLYFLRTPIFSKQSYISASATFSENAVYWNSWFSTANLVFTVKLFIYYLVFNPEIFRLKFLGVHRMLHHSKNRAIKYHEQKFCIKFAFPAYH